MGTKHRYAEPGSVSWGTMRDEDLIPAFTDVLRHYGADVPEAPPAVAKLLDGDDLTDDEMESVSYYLNEDLFSALDDIAPPGHYFGSHPGDGADYGFWACEDGGDDGEEV